MKKLFFSAFALLLIVQAASAQYYRPGPAYRVRTVDVTTTTYDSNFRPTFTLIGGMNISNIIQSSSNTSSFNTRTRLGVNAGIGFDLPVSYPLSITIEGLYSQKGYTQLTSNGEFDQRTEYIDVPLLLKFHVVPGFNILVGPQASFLVSTRNTFDNGFMQNQITQYNNTTDGYNKALITGVGGVSFDLGRNVELRGRYNIDLSKNIENGNTYVPSYRNSVFQVGLGIRL